MSARHTATIAARTRIPVLGGLYEAEVFSFSGLSDGKEHVALALGPWDQVQSPLARLHSECLTGDVFGSARCDCGPQLHEALHRAAKEGGVILYLRQEGRGIGLYNKLAAYALQDKGLDTYEANRAMDLPDDLRDYEVAAQMLRALGLTRVRLLSNNPDKQAQLEAHGIEVCMRISTGLFANAHNARYLRAKVLKSGHSLSLDAVEALVAVARNATKPEER